MGSVIKFITSTSAATVAGGYTEKALNYVSTSAVNYCGHALTAFSTYGIFGLAAGISIISGLAITKLNQDIEFEIEDIGRNKIVQVKKGGYVLVPRNDTTATIISKLFVQAILSATLGAAITLVVSAILAGTAVTVLPVLAAGAAIGLVAFTAKKIAGLAMITLALIAKKIVPVLKDIDTYISLAKAALVGTAAAVSELFFPKVFEYVGRNLLTLPKYTIYGLSASTFALAAVTSLVSYKLNNYIGAEVEPDESLLEATIARTFQGIVTVLTGIVVTTAAATVGAFIAGSAISFGAAVATGAAVGGMIFTANKVAEFGVFILKLLKPSKSNPDLSKENFKKLKNSITEIYEIYYWKKNEVKKNMEDVETLKNLLRPINSVPKNYCLGIEHMDSSLAKKNKIAINTLRNKVGLEEIKEHEWKPDYKG